MANASNPVRNRAEELIRAELARVGLERLDRPALIKGIVELGASRSRAQAWFAAVTADWGRDQLHVDKSETPETANPSPPVTAPVPETAESAAESAADRARVLDSLPKSAELRRLDAEAAAVAPVSVVTAPATLVHDSPPREISALPAGGRAVLAQVEAIIETASRVLAYSHGPDGKVRNARMALAAGESMRRTLETALKVYEKADGVELVERFIQEMLDAVRPLAPDKVRAVIEAMLGVQRRWAGN